MKFVIYRASDPDKKPHELAYRDRELYKDTGFRWMIDLSSMDDLMILFTEHGPVRLETVDGDRKCIRIDDKEPEPIGVVYLNGFQIEQLAEHVGFKTEHSDKYEDPLYGRIWAITGDNHENAFVFKRFSFKFEDDDYVEIVHEIDDEEAEYLDLQVVG